MNKYTKSNQEMWDELTLIHEKSDYYNLEGFRAGKLSLLPLEREEVGDVTGKKLLHLQCHFGMDTLSWARLGAEVTGADYSEKAIALAQRLARELDIPARFIQSDLYNLRNVLEDSFDIVFTTYGVLCWLPDLKGWAETIAHYLKTGGMFYVADGHPFISVFDNDHPGPEFKVAFSYFRGKEPLRFENTGDYADLAASTSRVSYEWIHRLSDIINSLIEAGLRIEFLHEFPMGTYAHFSDMTRDDIGWYHLPEERNKLPMLFSLKATKA